ncbi:MAG TPA: hypothetical protein VHF50_03020 [Solirubrobacterales bacterium]|nr:hypothetical protein [Solirubrobacterales bacterium]
METVREAWTDERLDDLSKKVDDLGRRMDEGFRELRGEISAMQRTMIQFAAVLLAAQIGMIASQLSLILS